MSHELRTPLTAIIGFSELLLEESYGDLNEKQSEFTKDIYDSGKHLLSLINDILDLSKIEAGKLELQLTQVNIKEILEDGPIMIQEKALKHGIGVGADIDSELDEFTIKADERKLKQIMFNLLSNAAKFTPDGGSITIRGRKGAGEVLISVMDTGIGIAPEFHKRIFEDFYQVKTGHRDRIPGTGLGLSLVKRMVEMHCGKVWVESEGEGKGSCFTFTLPF